MAVTIWYLVKAGYNVTALHFTGTRAKVMEGMNRSSLLQMKEPEE